MAELDAEKKLVRRMPTLSELETWVAEGKTLPSGVSY